ncbi:hypothetical protein B0J14DRAFT_593268 [Halenospora varia]|nr:hypothetical protein B0J14DRAFT_593268 [Halenospora varia]
MHFSTIVPTLVGACLLGGAFAQGHFAPLPEVLKTHPRSRSLVDREIQNLNFYTMTFWCKADILRFQTTLIIPATTPDASEANNVQAIWPGLQSDTLLQNVVTNQGGGPHEWYHLPFFCCEPAGQLENQKRIYPGDSLTSTYLWDNVHNKWLDSYVLRPGEEGAKAGSQGFTGGLTFDPVIAPGKGKPYDRAILALEFQEKGTWNFGPVIWKNVLVVALTNETKWCTGFASTDNLRWQASAPAVHTDEGVTTCFIAQVVFSNPIEKKDKKPS